MAKGAGFRPVDLLFPEALFLVLATLSAAAAGNTINDLQDTEADKHNKPGKNQIGNGLSQRQAWILYAIFLLISLLCAWQINLQFFAFVGGINLLLFFYSSDLKGIPVAGNLLIALLIAAVVFTARLGLVSSNSIPFSELALLAFFVNLSREMIKDAEDIEGDRIAGYQTLAVRKGVVFTCRWASMALIPAIALCFWQAISHYGPAPFRVHMCLNGCSLAMIGLLIFRERNTAALHRLSVGLKIAMVSGILTIIWL